MKRAGQPGPLTRLMSCSEEQLAGYQWLDIIPTYVAPNMAYDATHDDWYQPYNKPTAIEAWLRVSLPSTACGLHSLFNHGTSKGIYDPAVRIHPFYLRNR